MKKQDRKRLDAALDKALAPPRQKPKQNLDVLLDRYDEDEKQPTGDTRVTRVGMVTRVSQEAAPKRDFTRVANSIVRDAVPAGLFTGKGKQLYDYLYLQTRGAVVPVRSVRIPRGDVMRGAKMSRPTYRTQLARLIAVGLVKVEEMGGDHLGNLYTVYLPEETGYLGYPGMQGNPAKKVDGQPGQETDPGNPGLSVDFQRTSDEPKTSFKTNTEKLDDEAAPASSTTASTLSTGEFAVFSAFFEQLLKTSTEITGKPPQLVDAPRWAELGELLATELKIAAGRTGSVSNVAAFFTEHMRRRLWKKDARQVAEEGKAETPQSAIRVDASKCPDCFGAGMWYPDGYEKGVARCPHSKLEGK